MVFLLEVWLPLAMIGWSDFSALHNLPITRGIWKRWWTDKPAVPLHSFWTIHSVPCPQINHLSAKITRARPGWIPALQKYSNPTILILLNFTFQMLHYQTRLFDRREWGRCCFFVCFMSSSCSYLSWWGYYNMCACFDSLPSWVFICCLNNL